MPDTLVTASDADAGIAFLAAVTTELVSEIRDRHDLWPTAAAAAGRLATGAVLFGAALKGDERISLQITADGPLRSLAADAWLLRDGAIGARSYVANGRVDLPVDERGKFNVGAAVGSGSLQVTRSRSLGQPYVGVVELHSGEIAEDLALYLAQSEQVPSVVALGVLADPGGIVAAGGILAQALPGARDRALSALEERARSLPPVTQLVAEHRDASALLHAIAGDAALRSMQSLEVRFACRCSREKVEGLLAGLGREELLAMARERGHAEATCEYCKTRYEIALEPLLRQNANETARSDR